MPRAFRYSRWDGTQTGFDFTADDLLGELTDDLLYHGDLHAALRRLMQQVVVIVVAANDNMAHRIEVVVYFTVVKPYVTDAHTVWRLLSYANVVGVVAVDEL